MKLSNTLLLLAAFALPSFSSRAMDLKQSKFTEIVHDVEIISAANQSVAPAALDEIFKVPDVLRTGPDSRAELVADDQTVTRVGANTIFSFDPANRTIDLKQGSLLFHSPHGKGGGTIQTGAATASVLGTTIIVSSTPNGGFKVLVLEGHAAVKTGGILQHLNAGQMIYVLPGGGISPIVVFRLDTETRGSKLVGGFKKPLASAGLIDKAIGNQLKQIKNGHAVDTGLLAGDSATSSSVDAVPANTIQALVESQNSSSQISGSLSALQTDFTINAPALDINNIFLGLGFNITTDPNGFLGGSGLANPFFGFPGHNIIINTATVDLSPYAGQGKFQFVALNNLSVQNSVTFNGLLSSDQLYLAAGNQLSIASGSTVEADFGLLWIGGFQPITLDNVSLLNNVGELDLISSGSLTLQNVSSVSAGALAYLNGASVNIDDSSVAGSDVDIEASGTLTVNNNASVTANSGGATLNAGSDLTVDTASISTSDSSSLFAGGNLTFNGSSLIENSGTMTIEGAENSFSAAVTLDTATLTDDGEIDVYSDLGSLAVNNSTVTANDVFNGTAYSTLTIDNTTLEGDNGVTLTAQNDDLTIQNNSEIDSFGDINLYGGYFGSGSIFINSGSLISAGGSVNISAGTDLTLDTATVTGGFYNSSTLGAANDIAIGNSSVESGSLSITSSGGTVDVNNNSTVKSDTGDLSLEANTDATIDTSTVNSFGNLTLTADNNGLTLNGATLTVGSHAGLSGKTSVNMGNSSLTAGDVDIESSSGAVTVNNNSSITANSGDMILNARADLTVDNATLAGNNNNVTLTSANNDLSLNNDTITAVGTAAFSGKTSVTIGGGSLNADTVNLQSSGGSITVNAAATIAANTITLTAGDGILLDNVTMSGALPSTPGTLTATAANTINVGSATHSVDLSNLASVSMSATTINLNNVIFSLAGVYNFNSSAGLAAINPASSVAGDVNFFNCSIGAVPITLLSQIDVTTAASAAAGIHVF